MKTGKQLSKKQTNANKWNSNKQNCKNKTTNDLKYAITKQYKTDKS